MAEVLPPCVSQCDVFKTKHYKEITSSEREGEESHGGDDVAECNCDDYANDDVLVYDEDVAAIVAIIAV